MKELSIFVDESGDFGEYDFHAPYYIISMVFHDQDVDLTEELKRLDASLFNMEMRNHCIHAGPIIRQENEYKYMDPEKRIKLLKNLMAFVRRARINCESFYIEKKHISDSVEAAGKLGKEISGFIKAHYSFFTDFDIIKIYYDNGQIEVTRILSTVFHVLLDNIEFKKVIPSQYRLFQVADLICTLQLTKLKLEKHILSKSEMNFFGDERTLKKNYLKPMAAKKLV